MAEMKVIFSWVVTEKGPGEDPRPSYKGDYILCFFYKKRVAYGDDDGAVITKGRLVSVELHREVDALAKGSVSIAGW